MHAAITVEDLKHDLPAFLRRVEAGEALVLMKEGKPMAEIKPVASMFTAPLRPYGLCASEFVVPDDFDEPLPENVLAEFEGR
ncbi:type II toxin-antitoxin system Phd/YefM family antitoxin [candidate division KSB1 bacterium]|nr:type II toxin-antitoxin system Phd/YefM family antitoxin [candidate division KSB1 bacterium]